MKTLSHPNLCEVILPAMGGQFIYRAWPQPHFSYAEVKRLLEKAHDEVLRIEKKFTEFHQSDLTKLNDRAIHEAVSLDDEMTFLLKKSQYFFELSEGVFDPTYSTLQTKLRAEVLSENEKERLRKLVDFSKVELNFEKQTLYIPHKDIKIGLGGIGKGYAVDSAFLQLKNLGLINFSVNGSGDMRVHSHTNAPRPWKIGIRNPFSKNPNQSAGLIQIQEGSVSTSGTYVQGEHILRKENNLGKLKPVSTTILGETCMETDVWGTITMAVDIEKGIQFCNRNQLFAVLIDDTGKTHLSEKAIKGFGKQ